VVQVLAGEAYQLLGSPAQQVMQALAVYPEPVSAVGVDFLLRPVNPTTDAAPILTRLVRRQLASAVSGRPLLPAPDRPGLHAQPAPSWQPRRFYGLVHANRPARARAADYYAQIRTPRESWRSLDDVRPQLAEFELRCDTGDYDTAATVLQDIDFGYLQVRATTAPWAGCMGASTGGSPTPPSTWGTATSARASTGRPSTCTPGAGHHPRHRQPLRRG
jgi:hypothetical protein